MVARVAATTDIARIEIDVPRTARNIRKKGRRPVVDAGTHTQKTGFGTAATSGKEDAVAVGASDLSPVNNILRYPGPCAILH